MGADKSSLLGQHGCPVDLMARLATIRELEDWTLNGATWEPVELSRDRAVVELCTCHGERVDVVESDNPEFIAFVRSQRDA